jgi:GNAT superfamily N-acetyltransferase
LNIRSLALTTELALAALRGRVTDRGDYLVVEAPENPGFYDGNVLVLPAAPQVGEVAYWSRRFAEELGKNPAIKHVSLWWDGVNGDEGAADELRAAGFALMANQVMVADAPASTTSGAREGAAMYGVATIRALSPEEVLATADLAYILGDRHDESYRLFLDRRAAWHRGLVARGQARFWGAFDRATPDSPAPLRFGGDALVASLGLVWLDKLARYQDVQTLPSHRRRGLAGALLETSKREAFARGAERVVIIAEPGSDAARVYERVGFRTVERTVNARRV